MVGSSWLSLPVEVEGWDGPVCRGIEEPGVLEVVKCHPDLFAPLFVDDGSPPLTPGMYWPETVSFHWTLACFFPTVEAFKDLVVVNYSEQGSFFTLRKSLDVSFKRHVWKSEWEQTSNAKLEHVRERSWSLILPQLRLFQRWSLERSRDQSRDRSRNRSWDQSRDQLESISGTLSRTRVCVLRIILRSHKLHWGPK